jgi:hypothetical protein
VTAIRITALHFCAGVVLHNDVVVRAAPILKYMRGWKRDRVVRYAQLKGWMIEAVKEREVEEHAPE